MHGIDARGERGRQRIGFLRRADQRAERADHGEDAGEIALVERMHRNAAAAADFLNLPSNRIVELGAKVEI
jgi:K+ transporter